MPVTKIRSKSQTLHVWKRAFIFQKFCDAWELKQKLMGESQSSCNSNILFIGLHVKADFVPSVQVYVSLHIFGCVCQVENLLDTNQKCKKPWNAHFDWRQRLAKCIYEEVCGTAVYGVCTINGQVSVGIQLWTRLAVISQTHPISLPLTS